MVPLDQKVPVTLDTSFAVFSFLPQLLDRIPRRLVAHALIHPIPRAKSFPLRKTTLTGEEETWQDNSCFSLLSISLMDNDTTLGTGKGA